MWGLYYRNINLASGKALSAQKIMDIFTTFRNHSAYTTTCWKYGAGYTQQRSLECLCLEWDQNSDSNLTPVMTICKARDSPWRCRNESFRYMLLACKLSDKWLLRAIGEKRDPACVGGTKTVWQSMGGYWHYPLFQDHFSTWWKMRQ